MAGHEDISPTGSDMIEVSKLGDNGANADDQGEGEAKMTKAKWLACLALGLSYTTAFQQGACLGAIVKSIDEALGMAIAVRKLLCVLISSILGPTDYYNWMISASTITTSISLPLSGGLSDIFGRRYFVIFGCVIGIIASIVAIVAKDVPTIIASSVIAGLGAGSQQLAYGFEFCRRNT